MMHYSQHTAETRVQAAMDLVQGEIGNRHFTSKAKQKDSLEQLSHAYRLIRDQAIKSFCYDTAIAEEDRVSVWDIPFELHQIRAAKHDEIFQDLWAEVEELVALRSEIKSTAIVKPARKPKPAPTGNQHTHKGICQACGRMQAVNNKTGLIAEHGYQVHWSQFVGSCSGSNRLPIQFSTAWTTYIQEELLSQAARNESLTADDFSGKTPNEIEMALNKAEWNAKGMRRHVEFLEELKSNNFGKNLIPTEEAA